jgi:uncharacterized protein YciI
LFYKRLEERYPKENSQGGLEVADADSIETKQEIATNPYNSTKFIEKMTVKNPL